ncbi:MAG TPA: type II secretion system F family protein [Pyrinomonadaceae bacterium]|jgi:tight adherence protein C|nr:type II secretion system F family protein [Pyrinomonadaceae bacterium]
MLLISISTFICTAFVVMAVYWLMFRPASATAVRLRELDDQSGVGTAVFEDSPVLKFAERIATPINRLVPPSAADAKKLQKKLMMAGFRSAHATSIYRVLQLLSMVVCPGAVVLLWTYLARPMTESTIAVLFAFAAGFILPRFILNRLVASRQLRITWGLADALDLMVITMEAGLGLNAAMLKVCEELKEVHPDISKEFEIANLEIRVGRERSEALRNLAERTGVEDLNSLVGMLIQADRFGTSIAKAVRVYSDSLRTKRRQRAEQAAQKAAFKLLLPLGALLFPTMFIIILGPAMLNIMDMLSGGAGSNLTIK